MTDLIVRILASIAMVVSVPWLSDWVVEAVMRLLPERKRMATAVAQKVKLFLTTLFAFVVLILLAWLWHLDWRTLLLLGSSIFAIIGVALFASWSILSNITSFFILLSQGRLMHGAFIRVVDGPHAMEGQIIDMGLFHFELRDIDGNTIIYPNNFLIVRPLVVLKHPPKKDESPEPKDEAPPLTGS